MRTGTVVVLLLALTWLRGAPAVATPPEEFPDGAASSTVVGRTATGIEAPTLQRVTPAGQFVELPGIRPNALALSPDGRLLVTSGLRPELIVLDAESGAVRQTVAFPAAKTHWSIGVDDAGDLDRIKTAKLSFTGLAFSPDGSRIYLSNANGDIKVFAVGAEQRVKPLTALPLPAANAPDRQAEIPAGIALSPDGKTVYVALNLSNRLAALDATNGRVLHTWNVGVAPFAVALTGNKAYVSNWAGRRPDASSTTGDGGRGMLARVDDRSISSEGSVTVVDLKTNHTQEIVTGLAASALAVSPDGREVVVANSGSDTLSVIDTTTDQIVETLSARHHPADLFGAQPNALVFDPRGEWLYVCNGTQNAVAVFQFAPTGLLGSAPRYEPGRARMSGLIPVGWFPAGIVYDARRGRICVANLKQIAPNKEREKRSHGLGFNTHQYDGSLSLVGAPSTAQLATYTQTALDGLRYPLLARAALPARPDQPARPVPERVGEPSVFHHVVYIIKENRTFDQVLGDAGGDGDPSLCIFGRQVTPNEHKLVHDFVLLDNTYCCSILSADGHQWTDSAIANDYVERSFTAWSRSYGADALAYSSAGFIWNDALHHGKTVVNFGEFGTGRAHWKDRRRKREPEFLDCYRDFLQGGGAIAYDNIPTIPSLDRYTVHDYAGWNLAIPDVTRAARFTSELKSYEANGNLPSLVIVWLPNDHTSGVKPGAPTPAAQAADNDLAVGRVVEAVSHSRYWRDTCIFAIEDDPQDGWDHVSAFRTTAYVASPYTRRGAVVHTQYNQASLLHTIELMLGLPPMTQMDATATPMTDCFTSIPDYTPFIAAPNEVPLDTMNPRPTTISDPILRRDALASSKLPLEHEDQCPESVLNRILWHAGKGSAVTYPSPALAVTVRDDDDD